MEAHAQTRRRCAALHKVGRGWHCSACCGGRRSLRPRCEPSHLLLFVLAARLQVNAWEEGSKIRLFGCAFKEVSGAGQGGLATPNGAGSASLLGASGRTLPSPPSLVQPAVHTTTRSSSRHERIFLVIPRSLTWTALPASATRTPCRT